MEAIICVLSIVEHFIKKMLFLITECTTESFFEGSFCVYLYIYLLFFAKAISSEKNINIFNKN